MSDTGHFSSASGRTVWFVKANTFVVIPHAADHPNPWSSMSTRMSSATAIVGCVSLSWNATFDPNLEKSSPCTST